MNHWQGLALVTLLFSQNLQIDGGVKSKHGELAQAVAETAVEWPSKCQVTILTIFPKYFPFSWRDVLRRS